MTDATLALGVRDAHDTTTLEAARETPFFAARIARKAIQDLEARRPLTRPGPHGQIEHVRRRQTEVATLERPAAAELSHPLPFDLSQQIERSIRIEILDESTS
jgi:hypothetical protein